MKNHREIYGALLAGETICNSSGYETRLKDNGFMIRTFWFESPQEWYIKPKPKKVKYLKSMTQILEEYPDAYFDNCGHLKCPSWPGSQYIYSGNFEYLGRPKNDCIGWWPAFLIEERLTSMRESK